MLQTTTKPTPQKVFDKTTDGDDGILGNSTSARLARPADKDPLALPRS
jgi:hypothetical protein